MSHSAGVLGGGCTQGSPSSRRRCRIGSCRCAARADARCRLVSLRQHPALARRRRRAPHEGACPIFPASNPLNQDISHAPVDPNSAQYIESIGAERSPAPRLRDEPELRHPLRGRRPSPAEGADHLHRIRRRIRSRALPDPAERARGGRGGRRRPARARAAGGHVQAVRAVRGPAQRRGLGSGLGRRVQPAHQRAAPRRLDLGRRRRPADLPAARSLPRGPQPGRSTTRCA